MSFRILSSCMMTTLLALTIGAGASAAGTFVPELLDNPSAFTYTQYTDIDVDASGSPHVAYSGESAGGNAYLYYAWKSGDSWNYDDRHTGTTINFCAMELDGNGDAHFAIQANSYPDHLLVYYKYAGGNWSADFPELPDVVTGDTLSGNWPDITVNSSDEPYISYQWKDDIAATEGDLRLAFEIGGVWTIETVDGGADDVGEYTSITLSALERPRIAYYDRTNGNLMFARRSGTGNWTLELVDDLPDVGTWTDIAIDDDGDIHISYINEVTRALRYARKTDGVWATEAIPDGTHAAGDGTSIAIDSNGDPHIAYYYTHTERLRHIIKHDGVWSSEPVDVTGDRGWRPALALDADDVPHVSYMEEMSQDVYYATYETEVGVPDGVPALAHSLKVFPNPAVGGIPVQVLYGSAGKANTGGAANLAVYDLSGRRVRSLLSGGTGSGSLLWDGRTDRGAMAAPGVYFVRFEQGGISTSRRVHIIR
jgi:hypothetical protein